MKSFITGVCLLFLLPDAFSQNVKSDSIRTLLSKTQVDSQKVLLLNVLALNYPHSNTDSIFSFLTQALTLAKKTKFVNGESESLLNMSAFYSRIGNLPKALTAVFEKLRIEESRQNFQEMARCYGRLGSIYLSENDLRQALYYSLKEKELREHMGNSESWNSLYNISGIYLEMNSLDSALFYLRDAYKIALKNNDRIMGIILSQFGEIYEKLGNNELALSYYRLGLHAAEANKLSAASAISQKFAEFFSKTGHKDSAIFYATNSFNRAVGIDYTAGIVDAALLLSKEYEKENIPLAYHYYKIAIIARDSMFSIEKVKALDKLTAEEELHRLELAEEKIRNEENRKHAIQIAGISIFIPFLFFILMLLGKLKTNHRIIEFLGILSLLFVFEFITLIVHPLIEKWTGNTPVLMLVILVAIAAFLVPMHHRIEYWMKGKLVKGRIIK